MILMLLLSATAPMGATANGHPTCDESTLPGGVIRSLRSHYSTWHILTIKDLVADDAKLWQEAHHSACPGFVSGDFDGTGRTSYAATLLRSTDDKLSQTLILLSPEGNEYRVLILSAAQQVARASVVEKLPAGRYSSVGDTAQIGTKFPVIQYEAIESGSILYYWRAGRFHSLISSE